MVNHYCLKSIVGEKRIKLFSGTAELGTFKTNLKKKKLSLDSVNSTKIIPFVGPTKD